MMNTTAASPGRRRAYRDVVRLRRAVARDIAALQKVKPLGMHPSALGMEQLRAACLQLWDASDALEHGWWVPPR